MCPVIKPGNQPTGVVFNLDDIAGNATKYLGEMQDEATAIIDLANEQARVIKVDAQNSGIQAAEKAAEASLDDKINQQMQTLLPALQQVIEQIDESKTLWLRQWEKSAVHLAAEMAKRVVRHELKNRPEIPLDLVREALELAVGSPKLRIHLNPKDHEALAGAVEQVAAGFSRLAPAEIVADAKIDLGSCLLETEFGVIDQRFQSQLSRIEEELS